MANTQQNGNRLMTRFWGVVVVGVAAGVGAVSVFGHPHHVTEMSFIQQVGICGDQKQATFPLTAVLNSDTKDVQVLAVTPGSASTNVHIADFSVIDSGKVSSGYPRTKTVLVEGAPSLPVTSHNRRIAAGRSAVIDALIVDHQRPAELKGLNILVRDGAGAQLHLTDKDALASFPAACQSAP